MECNACGAVYRDGSKFCPKCGAASAEVPEMVACVACTRPVKAGSKFCPHCGASQVEGAAGAPAPDWVAEPEQDTAPVPSSERHASPAAPPDEPVKQTAAPVEPAPPEPIRPLEIPVEPPASFEIPSASVTPTSARPDTRKPILLWVSVVMVAATLAGGGALYFGLFSDGESTVETTSAPHAATVPVAAAPPVEPPRLLPEIAAVVEATPAAPEAASTPANTADTASAPKATPSVPGDVRVQKKASARIAPSTETVQPQDAHASVNAPKAESSKLPSPGAESKPSAESNNPFAECRKITKYFERVFCEEKARFKLCQGKWGTTPECPSNNFGE